MTAASQINDGGFAHRYSPPLIAVVIGLLCLWGMWSSARAGISRLICGYQGWVALTNKGADLSPADPAARAAYAVALSRVGEQGEAVRQLERAVALRPRDYHLWLELGRFRERAGDQEGAVEAFREAVRRAPFYAQPRWQLGNLLLAVGRRDEAFAELSRAAASDPGLFPSLVDSAWEAYGGDARAVQGAIQPQTTAAQLELARFFVKRGAIKEAGELFRAAGAAADWDRRSLLRELVGARRFTEAHVLWASGRDDGGATPRGGLGAITDGGFESEIDADDPGFGWQLTRDVPTARAARDNNGPATGAHALRVDWKGVSHPFTPVASQLVLVEAKTRYRLSFMARTQNVVTGGPPVVTVTDASRDDQVLVKTEPLPSNTGGWREYAAEFATTDGTGAVRIVIQRLDCKIETCPVFGRAWFDAFTLQRLSKP